VRSTPDKALDVFDGLATEATDSQESSRSFMDRLCEADRQALSLRACREWYAAGAVICQEGEPGNALYIVQRGEVAVLKELSNGHSTLLGYRGEGEILGEMSLVGQQPRFASLVAVEDSDLLRIDAVDFPVLMNNYPGISWAILNVLNDRLGEADLARTSILQDERRLARRVERLTNQAERLARVAQMRQESLALIAHDLRTPLAVIEGCLQMLQTSLPESEALGAGDILALATRSAYKLSTMIESLMEAMRHDDASLSLSREPVDVPQLVEDAVQSVLAMAEQSDISLTIDLPPDLPHPLGDAEKLDRVLTNLLDNAISYTPTKGDIRVAAQVVDGTVEVSVTDTGPGVPPEYRESIFERFVRVPGLVGRRKGFGLGLYFCYQVVVAHGGQIWVEPGPGGVGSRFAFTLPLPEETNS
jgi:signal transduction histidine kinase